MQISLRRIPIKCPVLSQRVKMLQMRHSQQLFPAIFLPAFLQVTALRFLSPVKMDCCFFFLLLISCPGRTALCILSQIEVECEQLVKISGRKILLPLCRFVQKSSQNLHALQP